MRIFYPAIRPLYLAALSAALLGSAGIATAAPAVGDLYATSGSNGIIGHLYTLNPLTGAVITDLGELRDIPGDGYGVTGIAFHPLTGVLYGSTANLSPTADGSLVSIDPDTAEVTLIGDFGITGTLSDITFNPATGVLYGWQSAPSHLLHTVNLLTGVATPVPGSPASADFGGGGLAMNSLSELYVTPDGSTAAFPTIQLLDPFDGSTDATVTLSGGFVGTTVINSMAFDPADILYGINNDQGFPSTTHLVLINPTTGDMTDVGATPDDLSALAFVVPEPGTTAALAACVIGLGLAWGRNRKSV